jgi:hypothetical protein
VAGSNGLPRCPVICEKERRTAPNLPAAAGTINAQACATVANLSAFSASSDDFAIKGVGQ